MEKKILILMASILVLLSAFYLGHNRCAGIPVNKELALKAKNSCELPKAAGTIWTYKGPACVSGKWNYSGNPDAPEEFTKGMPLCEMRMHPR